MSNIQSLVEIGELKNNRQDELETIVKTNLKKSGFNTYKQTTSSELYTVMANLIDRPISSDELNILVKKFGEKTVINYIFNGDRGSYYDMLRAFKDESYEKELIKEGMHPFYVSVEDAKMLHSQTHAQCISTHYTRLGSSHGMESVANNSLIYELFKKGVLMEITPESLQAYVLEKFNRLLPKPMAVTVASDINKQRIRFEGKLFTGEITDDKLTKKAIEKVTSYCMKNNMTFEQSNELGKRARKISGDVGHVLGSEIGKLIVNEDDMGTSQVLAHLVKRLCITLNTPVEDVGAILSKPVRGRGRPRNED